MGYAIWAEAPDVPGSVCEDARLRGGKEKGLKYPQGKTFGQAGWDLGIHFKSLSDLANQLTRQPVLPIKRGQVTRLAIHVHGKPGMIFPSGKNRKNLALTADNISSYHKDLHAIGLSTSRNSTILIVGCVAALGAAGDRLFEALCRVWPERRVVGFTTIGYVSGGDQKRPYTKCTEPGMRDTDSTSKMLTWELQQQEIGPIWKDLKRLPWASERSPNAKVFMNGKIIKKPKIDTVVKPNKKRPLREDKELYELWKKWKELKKLQRDQKQATKQEKRTMNQKIVAIEVKLMNLMRDREDKGLYYELPK